jgi:hypothetical protein
MNRRVFLFSTATAVLAADSPQKLLLATQEQARRMRNLAKDRAAPLETLVQSALKAGPWSVTNHRPVGLGVNAGPNDYYSEGPYWWPDPKNPKGPYIRKDGERNPERFMGNRSDLGRVCEATLALGMGAYLFGKTACVEHAAKILSTWFLDPKTRMNPNLEFGQAVRGHNTGRGTGIIDTASLIHVAQGVVLLEDAYGGLDASISAGMRRWFADYLKWMSTSKKGLDEKMATNNHATWWTAQAAAYATFTDNAAARKMCWDHFRSHLIKQIEPDGSCPREEERTQSLSYSSMNLDAFSVVCRLAELDGVDLWHFAGPKKAGVVNAFRYLTPFLVDQSGWKKPQITKYDPKGHFFPGLAGAALRDAQLLGAYRKLPHTESPWPQFMSLLIEAAA